MSLRLTLAVLATCLLSVSAVQAATFTSVQDGDWSDPATWGLAGAAEPGVTVPAANDYVHAWHTLTINDGDSYTSSGERLNLQAGANLVMNGGYIVPGRTRWHSSPHSLTVNGGYMEFTRTDNVVAGSTIGITGGVFAWNNWNPPAIAHSIDGGTLRIISDNRNINSATYVMDSGTFCTNFGLGLFVSSGSFTWNAGTVANLNQPHDYANHFFANLGDNAARRIDINDQTLAPGVAKTWNLKSSARDVYSRLMGTAGEIQFDVYSATDDDSDSIINATNNSSLGEGVVFAIGYAGDAITDPAAFLGRSYKLLTLLSSTDFSAITPSVPDAQWFDGANTWTVSFDNNLAVDGTVSIASIVPEPATLSVLAMGGLALLRRRR